MGQILTASPGQQCTIFLQTLDGYQRADSPVIPAVAQILFPNLVPAAGYPQAFNRISTGLYVFSFTLPTGASAVGSYLIDVFWSDPDTGLPAQDYYQIIVSAPQGNYSVTTG